MYYLQWLKLVRCDLQVNWGIQILTATTEAMQGNVVRAHLQVIMWRQDGASTYPPPLNPADCGWHKYICDCTHYHVSA